MNFICYDGRADHTVQSVERTYLTGPMLDAQAYLKQWQALVRANGRPLRITSGGNKPNIDALRHPHPLKRIEGDRRAWTCGDAVAVDRRSGAPRFRCASGCDRSLQGLLGESPTDEEDQFRISFFGNERCGSRDEHKEQCRRKYDRIERSREDADRGSRALPIDLTNTHAEGASGLVRLTQRRILRRRRAAVDAIFRSSGDGRVLLGVLKKSFATARSLFESELGCFKANATHTRARRQ